MSVIFYPAEFEISVDDPGYGYVYARGYGWDWRRIGGPDLGAFLAAVTEFALGGSRSRTSSTLPPEMDSYHAGEVLPALQRAVLLAAAGTDRWAIILGDDDAPEQLCAHCDEGTYYPRHRCQNDGHAVFGAQWDRARWRDQREVS